LYRSRAIALNDSLNDLVTSQIIPSEFAMLVATE
jgi:hypothetical protein